MAHQNTHREPFRTAILLISFLIVPAAFAQAPPNLAYSDLGPGNTYSPYKGLVESGGATLDKSKTRMIYAMPFQVDSSYTYYMSQVNVALSLLTGPGTVNIVFAQDNGGVPGPPIATKSATIGSDYGSCCSLVSVLYPHSDQNHIGLSPGITYWVETVLPEGEVAVWNSNIKGQGGTGAVSTDGGATWTATPLSLFGGFSVEGYILIQG